ALSGARHHATNSRESRRGWRSVRHVPAISTKQPFDFVREHMLALPDLTKFALVLAILVGVPSLSRRLPEPRAQREERPRPVPPEPDVLTRRTGRDQRPVLSCRHED